MISDRYIEELCGLSDGFSDMKIGDFNYHISFDGDDYLKSIKEKLQERLTELLDDKVFLGEFIEVTQIIERGCDK